MEWVTRINVPNSEDICPFPCEYWEHSVSVTKNSDSFEIFEPNSLVKVARTSMNPHVNEVEKFGWQDYLCLAGGAMGLWTGSSVVTILQITVGNVMLFSAFIYNITWSQQEKKRRFRLSSSQTDSSINNII